MRFLLALIVFALVASTADAQLLRRNRQQPCPSCPAPQFVLPGGQFGNCPGGVCAVPSAAVLIAVPKAMEKPNVPAPKFMAEPSTGKDRHGRLFYRVVKDRAYGQLVDRGVQPVKARKLVDTLAHESIDDYADHVHISQGIGDGKLLDWIIDHREELLALIKLIVSLLAVI